MQRCCKQFFANRFLIMAFNCTGPATAILTALLLGSCTATLSAAHYEMPVPHSSNNQMIVAAAPCQSAPFPPTVFIAPQVVYSQASVFVSPPQLYPAGYAMPICASQVGPQSGLPQLGPNIANSGPLDYNAWAFQMAKIDADIRVLQAEVASAERLASEYGQVNRFINGGNALPLSEEQVRLSLVTSKERLNLKQQERLYWQTQYAY